MKCAECGVLTNFLLVDEHDKPPLQFCSWTHLAMFAVRRANQEVEEAQRG